MKFTDQQYDLLITNIKKRIIHTTTKSDEDIEVTNDTDEEIEEDIKVEIDEISEKNVKEESDEKTEID